MLLFFPQSYTVQQVYLRQTEYEILWSFAHAFLAMLWGCCSIIACWNILSTVHMGIL